ncbi:MAG: thioredoxin domain-containing protein, partial [Deltaproteobacteria bacterium]|nr:thioredoxin domain-containing protein [Deltaproteobacteria bacterium]
MNSEELKKSGSFRVALPALILILAIIGIGLSIELSIIHYKTHTDPTFHSVCAVSENVNCESVALSPYSVFMGLPVSIWGIAGYLMIIFLAGASIIHRKKDDGFLSGVLFLLTLIALLVSIVMGYISYAKIASLCLFCMGTYIVNGSVAVLSFIYINSFYKSIFRIIIDDIIRIFKSIYLLIFLIIIAFAPLSSAFLLIPSYWVTKGWDEISISFNGVDIQGEHWIGAKKPVLTVYEFTDYQCPYCRSAHKNARKLIAKYGDRVRFIHKHFPLDNKCNSIVKFKFHEFACNFSYAVECAGQQGKFWEMNDLIFSSQEKSKAENVDINRFAILLGLNKIEFDACLKNKNTSD